MVQVDLLPCTPGHTLGDLQFFSFLVVYSPPPGMQTTSSPGRFSLALGALSQRFGHPRVLGIPIPISLAFWASPVGDAQNADHCDFA